MSATVDRVRKFIAEQVLPNERVLAAGGAPNRDLLAQLQLKAREADLWALPLPLSLGGHGLTLAEYAPVAEVEGESEFGPPALGSDLLLDATMLDRHATARVREDFLLPMVEGAGQPSFAMTEPGLSGSDPARMTTEAAKTGDLWVLNGRKWFTSRAASAAFVTVACRTPGGISMIVVPTNSPGFSIVRSLPLLGGSDDQYEIALQDVRVPGDNLVGAEGKGLAIVAERLALGRTLRCLRWLGQMKRTFDLLCHRLTTRRMGEGMLADKQLMHSLVFDSYCDLHSARAMTYSAVEAIVAGVDPRIAVAAAKVVTARGYDALVDRAIQVFGAEGLTDDTPLPMLHRTARAARILDGPDELHVTAMAKRVLAGYQGAADTEPVTEASKAAVK